MADLTGIPHQTLRRYVTNHSHHLIMKKKHKSYLISEDSIKVLERIRTLYGDGKSIEEVDNALASEGVPMSITVTDDEKQMSINIGEALIHQQNTIKNINEKLDEQMKFNASLLEALQRQDEQMRKQQEYIEKRLEERDKNLMTVIREMQETKKQIAVAEEKGKSFWTRFFGKW